MKCPDINLTLHIPKEVMIVGPDGWLRIHIVMEERRADIYSGALFGDGRGWDSGGEHSAGDGYSSGTMGDGLRSNLSTHEFSEFRIDDIPIE